MSESFGLLVEMREHLTSHELIERINALTEEFDTRSNSCILSDFHNPIQDVPQLFERRGLELMTFRANALLNISIRDVRPKGVIIEEAPRHCFELLSLRPLRISGEQRTGALCPFRFECGAPAQDCEHTGRRRELYHRRVRLRINRHARISRSLVRRGRAFFEHVSARLD
jgi:hypothetical protein